MLLRNYPERLQKGYDYSGDYGITEWLINYSAGFVRRGLLGEILHWLWKTVEGINPVLLIIIMSTIIYAVFLAYVALKGRAVSPSFVIPSAFIAGGPLFTNNVVRKDVLLLLIFAATIMLVPKRTTQLGKAITANVILTFGMLIHEMFAFIAFPATVYCLSSRNNGDRPSIRSLGKSMLHLAPAIVIFMVIVTKHDLHGASQIIHDSWKDIWTSNSPWPTQAGGSIAWLNKGLREAIVTNFTFYFKSYFGMPAVLLMTLNIGVGYLLVTCSIALTAKRGTDSIDYVNYLLMQTIAVIPLYIIAIDSGRWAILSSASAFILLMELPFRIQLLPLSVQARLESAMTSMAQGDRNKWLSMASTCLLFIGIPGIWWTPTGFVESAPIYQIWYLSRNLGFTPGLGHLLWFLK
jgi:hypothetical protein